MLYDVMVTSGTSISAVANSASTLSGVAPRCKANTEAAWITGPSMTGSLKGMPISMASAPAAAHARTASTQSSLTPPVMNGTSNLQPSARLRRNADSMRSALIGWDSLHMLARTDGCDTWPGAA